MSFYPAQSGGPSNTIYWLAKELALHDIEPYVVTTDKDIVDSTIKKDKWIKKDRFKIIYTTDYNSKYAAKLTIRAIKKLKEVDVVHFSSLFYPPNMIIAFVAVILRKKIIISTRGELQSFALTQGKVKLKPLIIHFYKFLGRYILFHGTSRLEIENINKIFTNKLGCIEISNYMDLPDRIYVKKKNQFIFVGRINRIKALHKIIEGFGLSKNFKKTDFTLCICGSGDADYIKELNVKIHNLGLNNRIKILGKRVRGLEKEMYYAESKFLVLLSESENFGNVVIEAMAQATPAITSIGTPWAILNNEKIGFNINNSPGNIAKYIDTAIDLAEEEYNLMSEKSYNFVRDNFYIKTNIYKWVNYYQKLF